jgi:hypothetical protein
MTLGELPAAATYEKTIVWAAFRKWVNKKNLKNKNVKCTTRNEIVKSGTVISDAFTSVLKRAGPGEMSM